MFLREFIYFDNKNVDPQEDNKYISQNDTSIYVGKMLERVELL